MKNIINYFLTSIAFFFFVPSFVHADLIQVDLSVNLNITQTVIEVGQPYSNNITITNSSIKDVGVTNSKVTYNLPSGSSYNGSSGSGWSCSSTSTIVTCTYAPTLTQGSTSNQLVLDINAPNTAETLNPTVSVSVPGYDESNPADNEDTDSINTGKSNLTASKTASKTPLQLGENFTYTIEASNPSAGITTVPAREVTITDTLPTEIDFVSFATIPAGWSCSENSKTITCNGFDLAVGETKSLVINVKAPLSSNEQNIVNTATIDTASSDYNSVPLNKTATVLVEAADVTITKTLVDGQSSTRALVGSDVSYKITVENLGESPASSVQVIDTLPTGVTYRGLSETGWTCSGSSTVTCNLDTDLVKGTPKSFNILVTMPTTHQTVNNTATVSTTTGESDSNNNSDTLNTYVKGADLNIYKTQSSSSTDIGTNHTYTINIENLGYATAKNVVVTDTLDDSMIYISDTGGCSKSGQILTCNIPDLATNATNSFTVTVKMPTNSTNPVTNSVSISTDTDQQNNNNTSDTVITTITGPNLNITKNASVTEVGLGKPFSYTINVTNVNTAPATNATITDQLPGGVTITSISSSDSWNCPSTPITSNFTCTLPTFAGGKNSSITFNATAPTSTTGEITNIANISHDLDTDDGQATAKVNVTGVVLDINKVASATAEVGGLINYSVTVSNNSHSDAKYLTFTDNLTNLGTGYTINSITNSDGWSCSGTTTLTCTRALLAAEGTSSTIQFNVNVPNTATLGTITNTASVTTTTNPQPTKTDSANTIIEGADIVVVPPTTLTAVANENVVFTVKVRNDGSATAKDVDLKSYFNTNAIADFTNIKVDCDNNGGYETTTAPYTCNLGDIAKNSSKTIKISATAPNYDSNFPNHVNIRNGSLATTTTSQSDETNDNADWGVKIHGADLLITKTSNISEVAVNGEVTYTISLTNQGKATATNIHITDAVVQTGSDGFKLQTATLNAGTGWSCNNITTTGFDCLYSGTLAQNQSTSNVTIKATAPNDINAIGNTRDNRISVTTVTAEEDNSTSNTNLASVTISGADLNITKTVSPNPAQLNEQVTYTISVTNNGLADAINPFVDDTLPNGHSNIYTTGCNHDGNNISGNTVHCTLDTLAQNETKIFTIIANAPNTNGNFENTATTSSSTLEKDTSNNEDSVTLNVQGADLNVDKWDSADPVATNSTYYYYIGVRNEGFSSAFGAEITDTLPSSGYRFTYVGPLEVQNANWECNKNGNDISCNTKDANYEMAPGYHSGAIVRFKVQAPSTIGTVQNTAVVDSNTSDSEPGNNTETENTQVINIDLQAAKGVNDLYYQETYIGIDGDLKYTIYVRNVPISGINPPGITDVNVTDIIPSNITNVTVTPSSRFSCEKKASFPLNALNLIGPGDTLLCTMNDGINTPLTVAESWVLVARIDANALDAINFDINNENNNFIINRYKAETSFGDQNLANNAPTTGDKYLHTNTLVRGANMSIVKTVSADPVGANQTFTYNLEVRNWPKNDNNPPQHDRPSTTAQTIKVQDTLPPNVTYINATGTNWSCNESNQIVTCDYTGTMNPQNSSSNITVTVKAPNSHNEILSNEANVTTVIPEIVRLLPDNTDTVNTTTQGTDISITKIGPSTAGMSDTVTYTITVSNTSSTPASEIHVLDTFPNGATYVGNISNIHWHLGTDVGTKKQFTYDQNLSSNSSTSFNVDFTLPDFTGTVRNHVEANTTTAEISTPNEADWDIDVQGANIAFNSIPSQNTNPVGAYENHQYQVKIKNEGLSNAKDINVTLTFNDENSNPGWENVTGSGINWTCENYDVNTHKILCKLPTLNHNTVSSLLTISSSAPNYNGDIINSISVTGTDDTNATTGQALNLSTTIKGSDLKIQTYAQDPDSSSDGLYHDDNITVGKGKPINFRISISNDNLGLAKDIFVTDTFPSGFSNFVVTDKGDWGNCTFVGATLTCNRNELASGSSASDILISATAPSSIGTFTNTAETNTTTEEFDATNNDDSVDIKVEGATLNTTLDVSKTKIALDEVFTYTLDITNSGRNDAIDINITDIIDSDFTYLDINGSDTGWTCTNNNNTLTCKQPLIAAYDGNSTLKLNIKAPANKIGTYSNAIDINSNSIENPIQISAPDIRVIGADIIVDINATPEEVLEDRNVTYVINVKDINISTAHDVVLKQIFSQDINALYITSGTSDCNLTDSNQSVTCTYPILNYNQDKNITVVATMPDTNTTITLTSTTTVTTSTPQENLVDHNVTVNVKVHPIIPVANYRFEECKWNGTSGEVVDNSNNLDGTAINGAQTRNHYLAYDTNNFSTAWRVGKFDGDNDYVEIPNDTTLQITGNQTMCAWVKPSKFSARRNIIAKAYGGEGTITQERDGSLTYYYGTNGGNGNPYQGFSSWQEITRNKWNHICIVRDLKKMKLKWYINNTKTHESTANYSQAAASSRSLKIGAGYVDNFKGLIDEVEIYNIALDDKAVNDIYNFEKNHKNYDGTERDETICGVNLKVTKTTVEPWEVGAESNLTYKIIVKNISREPVTKGFTLSDILPNDVNYSTVHYSANLSCDTGNDNNFTCTYPDTLIMKKNNSELITVDVTTANVDKVNITNTATATPVQPDSNIGNNSDSASNRIIGTDLKITKTATPESPNASTYFIYQVKIENISTLADAKDIIMTDSYDSRLTYNAITTSSTNESNISADCSADINNHIITCDGFNLSKGKYIEFNVTMISNNEAIGLENNSSVSSRTVDTDLSNNTSNISIDTNASVSGEDIIKLEEREFRNDSSVNKYGNIAAIGNTVLTTTDPSGRLIDINSTYVQNSSANLDIIDPLNNGDDNITIEYAGLFWGGHVHGTELDDNGSDVRFEEVTFITPDGINHTITASKDANATNRVGYYHFKKGTDENNVTGNYRIFYGAKADITSIIKDLNNNGHLEGNYAVANMKVSDGIDILDAFTPSANGWQPRDYGHFGGWSMVVSYSVNHRYHREVKFKNLASFSGFRIMAPQNDGDNITVKIPIKDFITPLTGNIESSLYSFIQGGDKEVALEQMSIQNKDNTTNNVIEGTNNTNNIFNSTITLKDISGNGITKNPDVIYNVGTDIDQFNLNSEYNIDDNCTNSDGRPCYLSNRQNATEVAVTVKQEGTTSEQAFANMISMQTQIFAPDFIDSYKECFKLIDPAVPQSGWVSCSEPLPLLRRGDIIKYRITAINTGDDYAKDVYVTDVLPPEVTLEDNSSIVSFVTPFNDPDANQTCSNSNYNYSQTVRDSCKLWLQDQVDGNVTQPYIIPDAMIDHGFNDINISSSKDTIVYSFPTFPKNHVAWMEFNTTVNHLAGLGNTIQNGISITFTNPTLDDFNYTDSRQTQVSLPVETSPITFNWQDINMTVTDIGKSTLRTKIVNEPFNLQITLHGISQYDVNGSGGATVKLDRLRFVDIYKNHNATPTNITNIPLGPNDLNATITSDSVSWTIPNVSYGEASRAIFFDMNISIHDGNYTASKRYPQDSAFENDNTYNAFIASLSAIGINVNPSNSNLLDYNSSTGKYKTDFTGDVFSTRPASFKISLTGIAPSGSYTIVNAGQQNLSMNIIAPDINEVNQSLGYDANLSNDGTAITIGLDSNFSTNPACLSAGDFNLTDANFVDGAASSSNIKYNEVGVIKILLKDSNWTYLDAIVGDCNATSGDNDSSDGLVSCSVDGNSSSIVFKPDHFTFTGTTIANHNNFTYMVKNPITDPMFSTIRTTVESRNADDNITTKFSNTCFADDVNLSILYDATSKDLSTISLSMANDNNITDSNFTDTNVSPTDTMLSQAYKGNFGAGSSTITLLVAVDRNQTTPQQPLKIDAQDINGSIDSYLGIASADVNDTNSTDISALNDLYFYYGRVHAPDYRFAGKTGNARVYYEVYCSDCNQTDKATYTIGGNESSDSIDWYINTLHTQVLDGNVSLYNSLGDVKFRPSKTDTTQSTGIVNGVETILVTAPSLPYKDKVEMNSTTWTTFNPTSFILEFQDEQKDWAGQGELGHIIDTNVSKRSNRRLDW